jgi:hypothetical protein
VTDERRRGRIKGTTEGARRLENGAKGRVEGLKPQINTVVVRVKEIASKRACCMCGVWLVWGGGAPFGGFVHPGGGLLE